MMLLLARGGVYRSGNPQETFDFQETYLRCIFGFIGFTDIPQRGCGASSYRKGTEPPDPCQHTLERSQLTKMLCAYTMPAFV
jgi:hypothetical protein